MAHCKNKVVLKNLSQYLHHFVLSLWTCWWPFRQLTSKDEVAASRVMKFYILFLTWELANINFSIVNWSNTNFKPCFITYNVMAIKSEIKVKYNFSSISYLHMWLEG